MTTETYGAETTEERAERIRLGLQLGWTEPTDQTFSGRLAGRNPEDGEVDLWPSLEELRVKAIAGITEPEMFVTSQELLACLLAEFEYWRNADVDTGFQMGAMGALANAITFATVKEWRAQWHPEKSSVPLGLRQQRESIRRRRHRRLKKEPSDA